MGIAYDMQPVFRVLLPFCYMKYDMSERKEMRLCRTQERMLIRKS